jgi:hypothetical protein
MFFWMYSRILSWYVLQKRRLGVRYSTRVGTE